MLFERKRVVQVMSRQRRSKRRVPRFPRRGGWGAFLVALHARVTRLLGAHGRGRRRRRGRVRYSRERSSNPRCLRECLRRSRWPRRRRGGGCLLGGRRAAAKHGPCGGWVRGGGAAPRDGPRHAERCARSCFYTCAVCRASGAPVRAEIASSFEMLVSYMPLAGLRSADRVFALQRSARH